jgi:hypothetical protein
MKRVLFIIILLVVCSVSYSQTIKKAPIFKGSESLTVDFLDAKGTVWFGYQNPDYKSIVDIVSFTVPNLDNAIALMDKVLYILEMPETGKDEHIYDNFLKTELVRYGFNQKAVLVKEKGVSSRGKRFDEKEAKELKEALLSKK